jgi:hypothetical protein
MTLILIIPHPFENARSVSVPGHVDAMKDHLHSSQVSVSRYISTNINLRRQKMTNAQMIQEPINTNYTRLYIAFELSNTKWKLAFSDGVRRRFKTVAARDLEQLHREIQRAKMHFSMDAQAAVHSCYKAVVMDFGFIGMLPSKTSKIFLFF